VAPLVAALRYQPEGSGSDSQLCYWDFILPITSSRTMEQESTRALTEMSTRCLS